jgi:hypothetical protein
MRPVLALFFLCAFSAVGAAPPPPAKLSIVRATLHDQKEDAPPIGEHYEYVSGEPIYLSFRIAGYQVKDDAVNLRWQFYITDPDGIFLAPLENGSLHDEVSSNDKDWLPKVQQTIALPSELYGGSYAIHLRVADEIGQSVAEQVVQFRVRGRPKETATSLTLRAMHLYRGEDTPIPVEPAVFAPGATIWVRFEIAGYALGEKNAYDVDYGMAVYRPSGQVLYEQPSGAEEKEAPYYPKRWLHGSFSLTLSGNLTPGEYRLTVRARDKIASTTAEQSITIEVRK